MPKRTKSVLGILCFIVLIAGGIKSCTHEHVWIEATCTEPRTCSSCNNVTEGEPLGHNWVGATCITRGTCSRCNVTGGSFAEHTCVDATCTEPESCSVCGKNRHWYSVPLGHKWNDATCTTPKTCSVCGVTEGTPQHYFISYSWETSIEPTCQNTGEKFHTCKLCGEIETQVIPIVDHKAGNWQVTEEATPSAEGTKKRYCNMCGLEMDSMQYQYQYLDLRGSGTNSSGKGGGNDFNTYNNESQQNTTASYVLNTSTMKFHRPSCRDVPKISPDNYATSSQSRSELISRGYSACGHCSP